MDTEILQKNLISTAVALWLVLLICSSASTTALAATSIYTAQTAKGTNDGSSCANAHSASWFNTSGNWGSGSTQIGPGTTVHLCGTITSDLTFKGSGTSGNYITVDGAGATMSATFFAGPTFSYGKIQNVTWADNFGRQLFSCTSCGNFIFTNNRADNWHGGQAIYIAEDGTTRLPQITASNNYIRTSTGNFGDVQNDIVFCAGCTNTIIEGNHFEMRIVGASPYSYAHDDVIQSFRKGGASLGPPSNLTIRYNKIVMNTADGAHRSWCMLEHLGGTNYIYGNLFLGIQGADGANGCALYRGQSGVVHHFIGNTVVAKGTASNNTLNLLGTGSTINIRNNIFYTAGNQGYTISMSTINRSNNLWYGTRAPACTGTGEICGNNPLFTDYANNDFTLQSGSLAKGAGFTFAGPYNYGPVNSLTWPNPTLAQKSSTWDIGAFVNVSGGGGLMPPANLRVQ